MTDRVPKSNLLLVDDDATLRLMGRVALEREGFAVECAADGAAAIARLDHGGIDCVVLDVLMPGPNGFEVCTAIRAAPWGAYLPVLLLTGPDDIGEARRAYEAGASDFAPKTLNASLIAQRVRFLLRSQQSTRALRASERRLRRAQQLARFGHWEWQPGTTRSALSRTARQILGLEPGSELGFTEFCRQVHVDDRPVLQAAVDACIASLGRYALDHRIVQPGGQVRVVRHEGVATAAPAPRAAVPATSGASPRITVLSVLHDITDRHRAEERLVFLAYHDEVTGLANRTRCLEFLAAAMRGGEAAQGTLAAAVVELQGLRRVANAMGDRRANELLRAVAARLSEALRSHPEGTEGLLLAWLGSEKFALVGAGLDNADRMVPLLRRLQAAASQPFAIAGTEVHLGAPAGIATLDEASPDAETLLVNAATAMLHARRNGPSACLFFAPPMQAVAARRFALEADLRRALPRGELWVAYQPRVDLRAMRVVGVEALARWTHPWQGPIRPDEFITIAEETGLIREIGSRVLRTACTDAAAWQARQPGVSVSVNVSGAQLRDADFPADLDAALEASGLDPRLLELEITESLLIENSEAAARVLAEVRARGVRIALDDFGTGYSSLAYLRRFPIDVVKIDRSFVRDLLTNADAASLVRAIIALTHSIGLHAVAEGVESVEQSRRLGDYGCDEAQGYYFCQPQALAGFLAWAEDWTDEDSRTGVRRALTLQAG